MAPRFYCPQLPATGIVELSGAELHHAKDVLRVVTGESVELFDGRGLVAQASIVEIHRQKLACEIQRTLTEPVTLPRIVLAVAVPKGERFDWLVEKATELGVARLIPLQTERGTVDPRSSKLARLRQAVIAACKQSRRAHLMELTDVMPWNDLLESCGDRLIVAHPSGATLRELRQTPTEELIFAVGPEGGFSPSEIAQANAAGCRLASLGRHPLRIETAALVLAGWGALQQS